MSPLVFGQQLGATAEQHEPRGEAHRPTSGPQQRRALDAMSL